MPRLNGKVPGGLLSWQGLGGSLFTLLEDEYLGHTQAWNARAMSVKVLTGAVVDFVAGSPCLRSSEKHCLSAVMFYGTCI